MDQKIIIVGAGAAGLMSARELAKAGKKAVILEARDRVGGRIWPLPFEEFGYPAQAGGEFVHGPAPVTRHLVHEAKLTFVPIEDSEFWETRGGKFEEQDVLPSQDVMNEKLKALKEDISIGEFLEKHFPEDRYASLRAAVTRMVEEYDAADSRKVSTFAIRNEWLSGADWQQGKIKEGYGALIHFLASECEKYGVEIHLEKAVKRVEIQEKDGTVICADGSKYDGEKILVTVAAPIISTIEFSPAIPKKLEAAGKIGFGGAIKILMQFKERWWLHARGKDLSKMLFVFSDEAIPSWWTQYPDPFPLLTGWLAGPNAEKIKKCSDGEILTFAFESLATIFQMDRDMIKNNLLHAHVANWPADPFARGAYSYSCAIPDAEAAYEELRTPVNNVLFFAGEALFTGQETATVEGALASAKETVPKML